MKNKNDNTIMAIIFAVHCAVLTTAPFGLLNPAEITQPPLAFLQGTGHLVLVVMAFAISAISCAALIFAAAVLWGAYEGKVRNFFEKKKETSQPKQEEPRRGVVYDAELFPPPAAEAEPADSNFLSENKAYNIRRAEAMRAMQRAVTAVQSLPDSSCVNSVFIADSLTVAGEIVRVEIIKLATSAFYDKEEFVSSAISQIIGRITTEAYDQKELRFIDMLDLIIETSDNMCLVIEFNQGY
jgi:hypothetical protein